MIKWIKKILAAIFGWDHSDEDGLLLSGLVRGISTMHLMQPGTEEQRQLIINILRRSRLKDICISVLCDGSFGYNKFAIRDLVEQLNTGNRRLHIEFYIINGPSARRWDSTKVPGLFVHINPDEFNTKIITDEVTQSKYKELCYDWYDEISYYVANNCNIRICPMLEDNLTDQAFGHINHLTQEIFGNLKNVEFVRNPCDAWHSAQDGLYGCLKEVHIHGHMDTYLVPTNGIVSSDGATVLFEGESPYFTQNMTLTNYGNIKHHAGAKNSWIYIWVAKYQGLPYAGNDDSPNKRVYVNPSESEQNQIIEWMRT